VAGDDSVSWAEVADAARRRLTDAGSGQAALDVRILIEEVTGAEPGEYPSLLEQPATVLALTRFDRMLERRLTGEPLQYVIGHWAFRRLDLFVDRRVLIPRPETELVVEYALAEITRLVERHEHTYERRLAVADLGTGSGAIALALASECPLVDVWATDVSEPALAVARANLAGIGRAGARVQVRHGSWFEALPAELAGQLGVVVANPPYVGADEDLPAEVEQWEPATALRSGPDGLDDARALFAEAPRWLRPDGVLVVELGSAHLDVAAGLARSAGFASVEVRPDLTGRDRCLLARLAT
jgi:release factor glutamine methyltransferase